MAHTLQTGKKLIKCLVIGGWGVPLVLTGIYAAVRATVTERSKRCWIEDDVSQWIIAGPILASVVINICILINLVRLLMTKLRQVPDAQQSRKAAKATLILVPLFGLQFLVFPVRPDEDSPLHDVYLHFMALLMSLQGTLVSIIFCFCNGEVRSLIMRKWHQHRLMTTRSSRKNTGFTSSTYVDGYSVVDTTRDCTKMTPDNATAGSIRASKSNNCNKASNNAETLEMKSTNSPSATTPLVNKTPKRDPDSPPE
ncbi:calcitonin receptor [Elysia marginata]|uniref:Calcitonin receptor n=1 Tax=Elysia marginata TaxID=1093978 RepID=A0AAV4F2G4_9GAST|nr:calcitonin receptor [Elysia marginata]